MATKTNRGMLYRFAGRDGKKRLVECLARQPLIAGDKLLAKEIAKYSEILDKRKGSIVIKQDGTDNYLFFIITGSLSVSLNCREIAVRNEGTHFGEMALIDSTVRRSTTMITKERSILLRISESDFSNIAKKHPQLWRRMAVAISARLRERAKFHIAPHSQSVIFIGSSKEGVNVAKAIYNYLSKLPFVVNLWSEGVFQVSLTTIEELWRISQNADFSVIVLSSDDVRISRGKRARVPRDNAIFELGLFMGSLGRRRTFIVTPDDNDLMIPTDLLGLTCLRYKRLGTNSIARKLQNVNKKIKQAIIEIGPR